jgi:hypothetical protein
MLLVNLSKETQTLRIVFANGSKDSIVLMARGRAKVQEGVKLDPDWIARNPNVVRVISDTDLTKEKERVNRIYEAAVNASQKPAT